jgi:hypothetical protein
VFIIEKGIKAFGKQIFYFNKFKTKLFFQSLINLKPINRQHKFQRPFYQKL